MLINRIYTLDDLVGKLTDLATYYQSPAFDPDHYRYLVLDPDLAREIARDLHRNVNRVFDRALNFDRAWAVAIASGRNVDLDDARDLAQELDRISSRLRLLSQVDSGDVACLTRRTDAAQVLRWLAWLLTACEREQFVAEARGNLGVCERWWQRLDVLVTLAIGTPRLAVMMRREERRGRVR